MNTKMEIKTTTCAAVLLLSAGLAAGCKDGTAPREVPAVSVTTLHVEARPAGGSLSFSGTAEGAGGTTQSFMTGKYALPPTCPESGLTCRACQPRPTSMPPPTRHWR